MDAEADVEDVLGGICLTLVLPHLKDLKVNVGGAGHNVINIKATRMISKGDQTATRHNSIYVAEFTIAGTKHITENNLSYYAFLTELLRSPALDRPIRVRSGRAHV